MQDVCVKDPELGSAEAGFYLPFGKSLETRYACLSEIIEGLKSAMFTGYLDIYAPSFRQMNGGEGKILFLRGMLVAAYFKNYIEMHIKGSALARLQSYPMARIEVFAYDENDAWLSIERNRDYLLEEDSGEAGIEVDPASLSREELMARYRLKDLSDKEADELIERAME